VSSNIHLLCGSVDARFQDRLGFLFGVNLLGTAHNCLTLSPRYQIDKFLDNMRLFPVPSPKKKADNRFRNPNVVAKEKRNQKHQKVLSQLGIEGCLNKKDMEKELRRAKAERIKKGLQLLADGLQNKEVAKECGVHPNTVSVWKKKYDVQIKALIPEEQEDADAFEEKMSSEAKAAVEAIREQAQEEEQEDIAELADSQASPQEQYQAYVAAQGIRLMRDGIKTMRPPRTVKEFSDLDTVVRRAMGLGTNPSGGGKGSSSISIDVNILHNTKATRGGKDSVVVDAEPVDDSK